MFKRIQSACELQSRRYRDVKARRTDQSRAGPVEVSVEFTVWLKTLAEFGREGCEDVLLSGLLG